MQEHNCPGESRTIVDKAIKKYGKIEKVTIIERCLPEELNEKEKYWIKKYNSTDKNIGYNISSGGEYDGKIFCSRHYRQLLKYGKITKIEPDIKVKIKKCDICGDEHAKSYHIWVKDGEYKNKTMCRKHWDQMYRLGYLKDNKPAKHKTGE